MPPKDFPNGIAPFCCQECGSSDTNPIEVTQGVIGMSCSSCGFQWGTPPLDTNLSQKLKALVRIGAPISHSNLSFRIGGQLWGRLEDMLKLVNLELAERKIETVDGRKVAMYSLSSLGAKIARA